MAVPAWVTIAFDAGRKFPSLTLVLLVLGAYGLLWHAFNGGLARADELQQLNTRVDSIANELGLLKGEIKDARIEALQGQLFEAHVSQCRAESDELKKIYGKRVSTLQESYRSLTGNAMSLPACGDL